MKSLIKRIEELVLINFKQEEKISELNSNITELNNLLDSCRKLVRISAENRALSEDKAIVLRNELMQIKNNDSYKSKFEALEARYLSDKDFFEHKIARLETFGNEKNE